MIIMSKLMLTSSRSPWWSDNAKTKPASAEQLRISLSWRPSLLPSTTLLLLCRFWPPHESYPQQTRLRHRPHQSTPSRWYVHVDSISFCDLGQFLFCVGVCIPFPRLLLRFVTYCTPLASFPARGWGDILYSMQVKVGGACAVCLWVTVSLPRSPATRWGETSIVCHTNGTKGYLLNFSYAFTLTWYGSVLHCDTVGISV